MKQEKLKVKKKGMSRRRMKQIYPALSHDTARSDLLNY